MVHFLAKGIKLLLLLLLLLLYTLFIMYALELAGLQSIATGILTAAGAFNINETVSIGDIFGSIPLHMERKH
ncbi:MAG: hypothetical protein ACI815_000962 [Psychroserpens sp.]|jgi:hypothetical protein